MQFLVTFNVVLIENKEEVIKNPENMLTKYMNDPLGKQAYVCRDCQLVCHKPCHIKVPDHCMETSLPKMEL